jgi:hypothetical protein
MYIQGFGPPDWRLDAMLTILLCKTKKYCCKNPCKIWQRLSRKASAQKRAVFPMAVIMTTATVSTKRDKETHQQSKPLLDRVSHQFGKVVPVLNEALRHEDKWKNIMY